VGKGLDLVSRITGVYSPYSWIPGDYFDDSAPVTANEQTTVGGRIVNDLRQAISSVIGFGRPELDPSFNFLQNTGGGQKSVLFNNLEFNKYRPEYRSSQVQAAQTLLGQGIQSIAELGRALGGTQPPAGQYYLGTQQTPIPNLVAPPNDQPTGMDGVPVYGYTILGKTYEGEGLDGTFRFGFAGRSFYNQGDIQGGFSWAGAETTPIGAFVGPNGTTFGGNASSTFGGTVSDGFAFTKDSILDKTQQLVLSNPGGGKAFESVGNAINQVSKIFNDGYKEITKGSKVIKYVNENGIEKGAEYCRIFTKDQPFTTMSRLQKKTRNIRGFTYSNLDSPYNLNITPTKGEDSTNLTNEGVKKYMFSLENLAWKPSNKQGYTVQDLPLCERGPNGGRIMWFPPYELTFAETLSSQWNKTEFIGRPEPVYTYGNATRGGTLAFKIIVDHPSVLNLIVDKVMKGQTTEETNSILESFFSGCKEYDLYELAALYNTIPLTELQQIQEILNVTTNTTTVEGVITQLSTEQPITETNTEPQGPSKTDDVAVTVNPIVLPPVNTEILCYFRNKYPLPNQTVQSFQVYWDQYKNMKNTYVGCAASDQKESVGNFFQIVINENINDLNGLCDEIEELCNQKYKVTLNLVGNTSSIASDEYNLSLSQRRIDSIKKYILDYKGGTLGKFGLNDLLIIKEDPQGETNATSAEDGPLNQTVCSLLAIQNRNVRVLLDAQPPDPVPAPDDAIEETASPQNDINTDPKDLINGITPPLGQKTVTTTSETIRREISALPGLSKKVLRNLLTECSYFEMLKEDSPVIYDSLKEKLKYFHPAFHAITPEGLNSRLTFLNQCTRPGSTIPIINDRGQEVINDSENTSFGAPPICVLRVGDFYNTKIAINSISLSYEGLDINPEGIGIQPMIAAVQIAFDFIGGSGLKEPINRLQNALSFNYYANTEMYDERAEASEDTSVIDNNLYKQIQDNQRVKTQGDLSQQNNGGTYIGTVVATEVNGTGFTGTLSYEKIMNETKNGVKNYAFALTNNLKSISSDKGWGFMYEINNLKRNYQNGNFYTGSTTIYGSPQNIQGKVDEIFTTAQGYFENDEGYLMSGIAQEPLKNKTIRTVRKNLIEYITQKKNTVSSDVMLKISEINTNQVNLITNINKINYVTTQKSDGFFDNKGNSTIADVALPTTDSSSPFLEIFTLIEYIDYIINILDEYYVFDPTQYISNDGQYYYEYLTLYKEIVSEVNRLDVNREAEIDTLLDTIGTPVSGPGIVTQQTVSSISQATVSQPGFIDFLLKNVDDDEKSKTREYLKKIIKKMYTDHGYEKDKKETETQFNKITTEINSEFEVFEPFQNSTGFAFGIVQNISPNTTQIDELKNLYDGVNTGPNDSFNGKENFV